MIIFWCAASTTNLISSIRESNEKALSLFKKGGYLGGDFLFPTSEIVYWL